MPDTTISIPKWTVSIIVILTLGAMGWAADQSMMMRAIPKMEATIGKHDERLREMRDEVRKHDTLNLQIDNLGSDITELRSTMKEFSGEMKELRRELNASRIDQ